MVSRWHDYLQFPIDDISSPNTEKTYFRTFPPIKAGTIAKRREILFPCSCCGEKIRTVHNAVHVLAIPGSSGVGVRCRRCGRLICNECTGNHSVCPHCASDEKVWYTIVTI